MQCDVKSCLNDVNESVVMILPQVAFLDRVIFMVSYKQVLQKRTPHHLLTMAQPLNIKLNKKHLKYYFLSVYMDKLKFIKLNKNTKTPIKGQYFKDTLELKDIDTNKYNVGLVAGSNSLIILDIDIKDGGLMEWNDYRAQHFEPYTMKQQTPSGGYHYIFKQYDDTYTEKQNELIKRLRLQLCQKTSQTTA